MTRELERHSFVPSGKANSGATAPERRDKLRQAVQHAAHLLPMQGPIGVFVHHNTLHAFEHMPFEHAVIEASHLYGTEPYMAEAAYRAELARGRIHIGDIDAVLDSEPDAMVFPGLTRKSLRRAMMTPGVREFDAATILWRAEQGDLATDFRQAALQTLFDACFARAVAHDEEPAPPRSVDEIIHPWLIRLCSVFLDQGMAYWPMPHRERGFYESVRTLLSQRGGIFPRYLRGLDEELRRQDGLSFSATDAVLDYLDTQNVSEDDWKSVIQSELLALPGWAGLIRRLEENPGLAPHEAVPCSLMDFLAVRLAMSGVASRRGADENVPQESPLKSQEKRRLSRAARVYDAARVVSLSAGEVKRLSDTEWLSFVSEVKACNGLERRRILHLAYERWHERRILGGLASHRKYRGLADVQGRPAAQVFFCIDEREESMRRALEETDPEVETFSAAGYFGVAVNYQGIDDANGAAFCPVVVTPRHAVTEQPKAGDNALLESRRWRRRLLGLFMRNSFASSRTLLRGWLSTSALGLLSAVPLIGNLLAPRRYAQMRDWMNKAFLPEPRTELRFMRNLAGPQDAVEGLLTGFADSEKAESLAGVLGPAGLRQRFSRIVVILGHGSTSLNNPHESAYDCGACGGRRGGPNARLFAAMANRPEVRFRLREKGIDIPDDTWFVGGYHDTCSDDVEMFDLEALPATHRADFERIRESLDKARTLNAHERVRRFESCPPHVDPAAALRHVEERSEHLAQPQSECGHSTNAVCVVGRRSLTRGLFLDRRAFLAAYDACQDTTDRSLAALLAAVVPVCAGISLEYYFSFVDNDRYGCGTKLPHNVTSLVGVMDGHASDLRTGLPWQMVSIHEPVRILFVVETTPERLVGVIDANASLKQLVENRWIRIATIDPDSGRVHVRRAGGFEESREPLERMPVAMSSAEWYSGQRQHLPMAWIPPAVGGIVGQAILSPVSTARVGQVVNLPSAGILAGGIPPAAGGGGQVNPAQAALVFVVLAPGVVFGALALLWLLGWEPGERLLSRITGLTFSTCVLALGVPLWKLAASGGRPVVVTFGNWFAVQEYHFPLVLMADRLSLPFLGMTVVLAGLIGQFSATYLHREQGFLRFFLLLHLFAFGSLLAFAAGSFDLLAGGWELVGITSVLLVAFFHQRPAPVENALRVFGVYRACDIGLLVGIFALHHWAGTASFADGLPALTGKQATVVCLLLLLAAAGKAAQVPFSGWLPRAMEGPTPSSAIFYGAISIHAGAYLLLRVQPLLARSAAASASVIAIGVITAIYGTISCRASADAKTSLSFASLTQVGVVFVEIGLGWRWIAVAHILGHAVVRTLQFLRAPSMLHDYHRMQAAIGAESSPAYLPLEDLFPDRAQMWLYRWALDRGHLDTILDRWVIGPLMQLSELFSRLDRFVTGEDASRHDVSGISVRNPAGQEGD